LVGREAGRPVQEEVGGRKREEEGAQTIRSRESRAALVKPRKFQPIQV